MLRRSAWIGGVLVFLIALVVMAPAALLPQLLAIPHVKLEDPQGTMWRGEAETFLNSQHIGMLAWRVRPVDLIEGKLTVDISLERDGVSLTGVSTSKFDVQEVSLNGVIGSRFVNVFTLAYDINLAGELAINDVVVRVDDRKRVDSIEGDLTWNGGPVRFKLANVMHEVTLEPVLGTLALDANLVVLSVRRATSNAPVLAFRFDAESGWVHLRAFPAFLEFANIPSNYLMQDADFLFEVSQKLL